MLVGPFLAVRLSLRQFHAQKWWEKKEQVYSTLLENLSLMREVNINRMWAEQTGRTYEISETEKDELAAGRNNLKKSLEHGSYFISEEAGKALREVFHADGEYPMEFYEDLAEKLTTAIETIRKEACVEIKPVRR